LAGTRSRRCWPTTSSTALIAAGIGCGWLTPLRAYAGGADEAIPAEVSRMVVDFDRLLGGGGVEFFSAGERADQAARRSRCGGTAPAAP
jgi:hypothetical protein